MFDITAGKLSIPLKKNDKITPKSDYVINSSSESDINNEMQVIVERDVESNNRQTEKTWKM